MFNFKKIRKKILFVVDVRGWAYDDRAKKWQKYLGACYDIDIIYLEDYKPSSISVYGKAVLRHISNSYLSGSEINYDYIKLISANNKLYLDSYKKSKIVFDHSKYDGIVFFYGKALMDTRLKDTYIPKEKTAICINNEKWNYEEGAENFINIYARDCSLIIGCNNFIIDNFSKHFKNIVKASQLVDHNVFYKKAERKKYNPNKVIFGFSGNYQNKWKNIDIIKKACKAEGVSLVISKNRARKDLRQWYNNDIDAVICASTAEGGPMCLLEAAMCNVPVITTKVGIGREFLNNDNCYIINASVKSLRRAIREFKDDPATAKKRAQRLHNIVRKNWTYEAKAGQMKKALDLLTREEAV